ncbi:MAG TPA: hypothetical protein VKG43_02225 [Acidimicrobiales bacterium]|nr:hypothetical protein [Acidimicrobiales bacterium]
MSPFNRREFLKRGGSAVVAAGVVSAVPAAIPALAGAAPPKKTAEEEAPEPGAQLDEPLVAHVRDLGTGEIGLFYGDKEITYHDPKLAARLHRAAR